MQVGLLGFPQAGKKTLFRLLTGVDPAAGGANGAIPGISPVRDPRVDRLAALYRPRKTTRATIHYWLLPDVTKDSAKNQGLLKALQQVDALGLVIRAFEDEAVFHLEGSVDPIRDFEALQTELLLSDLLFVERRLERMAGEAARRAGTDRSQEQGLFGRLQAHLNGGLPLRTLEVSGGDARLLSGAPLLTRKPLIVILNVGEDRLADRGALGELAQRHAGWRPAFVQISAKIEEELSRLDEPAERQAFLEALGIAEPAIDGLTRVSFEALGLISYFTVGPDEVKAWTVRRGASAAEAGGAIHSDIERGFIRAELMTYEDLTTLGSEQAVASAGKAQVKGRGYVVQDGDILGFRFSV